MDLSWVKELEFLCFWIGMVPKFPQLHHPNETQTLVDIRLGINMKWTWDLLARCRKAYYRYKVLAIDFQKLRISNQKSRFTQRNGTNILPKKLETQETKNRPCGGGGGFASQILRSFFHPNGVQPIWPGQSKSWGSMLTHIFQGGSSATSQITTHTEGAV